MKNCIEFFIFLRIEFDHYLGHKGLIWPAPCQCQLNFSANQRAQNSMPHTVLQLSNWSQDTMWHLFTNYFENKYNWQRHINQFQTMQVLKSGIRPLCFYKVQLSFSISVASRCMPWLLANSLFVQQNIELHSDRYMIYPVTELPIHIKQQPIAFVWMCLINLIECLPLLTSFTIFALSRLLGTQGLCYLCQLSIVCYFEFPHGLLMLIFMGHLSV